MPLRIWRSHVPAPGRSDGLITAAYSNGSPRRAMSGEGREKSLMCLCLRECAKAMG